MRTESKRAWVLGVGACVWMALGCSGATRRGVVVMKVSETEAHVALGAAEVKPGDRLTLLRYLCTGPKNNNCEMRPVGRGVVVQVINDTYSVARFEAPNGLTERDRVELVAPQE